MHTGASLPPSSITTICARTHTHAHAQVPLSLKVWPTGEAGDRVGVMLTGTFHPFAGQPPAPLQALRVDLSASSRICRLEPDARSELEFLCCSTQPPSHPAYKHVITLTNLQVRLGQKHAITFGSRQAEGRCGL